MCKVITNKIYGLRLLAWLLVLMPCFVLCGGCATTSGEPAAAEAGSGGTTAPADSPPVVDVASEVNVHLNEFDLNAANEPNALRFHVDDIVQFLVWQHEELTHDAPVQVNGNVTLPLIGEVRAVGRTPKEIREEAESRLKELVETDAVRVKPLDTLKMVVWQHDDLMNISTVQTDGTVAFPLVGSIPAQGRTLEELQEEVRKRLARTLRDPQVTILPEQLDRGPVLAPRVSILPKQLVERSVAVLGEVQVPGLIQVRGHMRALDALAMANVKESAQMNNVIVIRDRQESAPSFQVLRLADYVKGEATGQNIYLQADDVIIVPKTTIAKVHQFIDNFFVKTKPVLDWWIAFQGAHYAERSNLATMKANEAIAEELKAGSYVRTAR